MQVLNSLVITEADLAAHQEIAYSYLKMARQRVALTGRTSGTFVGSQSTSDEVSLLDLVNAIDPKDELFSDEQLHTLRAIRRGLQMGFQMADQFRQRSGAASFESARGLSDAQTTELNEKMQTAGAIAVFSIARFILWDMRGLTENNSFVGNIPADFEKIDISTPRSAIMCLMYYLGKHVEKESNGSDDRLVAAVAGFAQAAEAAILNRSGGLKYTDAFTSVSYTLEETDFSISGFAAIDYSGTTSVSFNRVEMSAIVGNADAKHFAKRLAMRLLCYNMAAQKNVFTELGGLAPVWMGYGKPGTGKSMLIAAVATLLQDYCDRLGIEFFFNPLPDNIIDSYQGNSAKNMVAWMMAAQDPTRIVFSPIDDAENILEERTRQGVSEGVRAAIGVFLRNTEGAYAVNHGNATFGVFTNLPEQIDAAVRSRIQGRMIIDGADSVEDFLDQDYLWFEKFADQEGFNNLSGPASYEYMSAQRQLKTLAEAEQTRNEPEHPTVAEIFAAVREEYDVRQHEFIANLYMKFMERFKTFSSRDSRNIQSAVNQRIMDFDLPEAWFETPEAFSQKTYEEQKAMVIALRNENMGGLSLAEIFLQEVIRYLDNYARIADAQFDRDVEARVEQVRVQQAVQKRVAVA